ncbi:glycoside hydrolase family 65 protein [Jatrophihabitans sp. DSM 45814]
MIRQDRYPVEPWQLRELGTDPALLSQSESLFALSNGHIGIRGNLDEGDPSALPGTYLNSFFESRPLPYAEAGYGYPESGQTVVNVTDGKLIRLLVDDEPFDLRYGEIKHHERILDLRAGLLHRVVEWTSPSRRTIRVRSTRMVSLTQRAIVAIHYEVEAIEATRVVIQSELVANEEVPPQSGDPRVASLLGRSLEFEDSSGVNLRALLAHRTRASQLRLAVAMDHIIDTTHRHSTELAVDKDWARVTLGAELQPGQRIGLTKFVSYGWSSQRSLSALRDQVEAALTAVIHTGWQELVSEQRKALDVFWQGADVELDGDPAIQQAIRFALFHLFQAATRAEGRAIAAKGLTGPGYDGHAFWDTESFVLPVLTATAPQATADALRWRLSTIDLARERARTLHLDGAAFAWRTIRGQECSGYWPAGTAAMHINADIAVSAMRHVRWTGDEKFEREVALPLLVETARLWISLGYHGHDDRFHIDGVTGPDEYSADVDDNTYTNLMAKENLSCAAEVVRRHPNEADDLDVTPDETALWEDAARVMAVSYDDERDIPAQDRNFNQHDQFPFQQALDEGRYPLLLHVPYFGLYRKQVIKQADLVLALHWCGNHFDAGQKARAFAYYEGLTVRDSSLSACTQAIIAAEVGHLDLAHAYLAEAALMDLYDLENNTRDGLHIASLAGAWLALVAGFGGMRDHDGQLSFRPQLPKGIDRLAFTVRWHDVRLRVEVRPGTAVYTLDDGADARLQLVHEGKPFTVTATEPVTLPITNVVPMTPPPSQPVGREPIDAAKATAEAEQGGGARTK